MAEFRYRSKTEQVVEYLREEMTRGHWGGLMPGRPALAEELGIDGKTVEAALRILEREGVLVAQGAGKKRRIVMPEGRSTQGMRVQILLYERLDRGRPQYVDLFHRLYESGHAPQFSPKSLRELGMDVERVAAYVKSTRADAWVVSGATREILEWFIDQGKPVIAEFGRFRGLPIAAAGVRKIPAMQAAVRHLHELGHSRISLLTRDERRKPFPALFEQTFLNELESLGIITGSYNLPDWENRIDDFHRCLDMLFQHTPPTALLVCEAHLLVAARDHLAQRGIVAPRDISLICDDPDVVFSWCAPSVSHIHWSHKPVVRRIVRWVNRTARGIEDREQYYTIGEFIKGGTIGPVPKS